MTIENAKDFPKIFYCRHMLPGIARYENRDSDEKMQEEHILIDADAMKQSAASMVGKPVYVQHQTVDLQNIHEADGFVTDCFYNELDGWLWAKFLAVSDEAKTAILNNWSVSNAYMPVEWDGGGQHLNVDYDRKIRNYEFTHLAIVPNPRYEEAKIFSPDDYKAYQAKKRSELDELQNSNSNSKGHPMLKFFTKKTEELKNGIPADADLSQIEIEVEGGVRKTLAEIVNAVKKNDEDEKDKEAKEKAEKEAKENKKEAWNDDTEVCVGDKKMPMKDLMNKYNSMIKKNSEEEEKAKKEKENADKDEKEKKEKEEKENAKRMLELQNAHKRTAPAQATIFTSSDKVKRGKERYG